MPQEDKAARTPHLPRKTALNLGLMVSSFQLSWLKICSTHQGLNATSIQDLIGMDEAGLDRGEWFSVCRLRPHKILYKS